jgi:hypothetical protein
MPAASTVAVPDVAFGGTATATITRSLAAFTHKVIWTVGTSHVTTQTNIATSTTLSIPLTWADAIPSATTLTATCKVETYNGAVKIGETTKTFSVSLPASVVPTATALTAGRVDNTVPAAWGIYVQGKSAVTLTLTGAAGIYGSTIASYVLTGNGQTGTTNPYTTGVLNNAGTVALSGTAKDSRGRSTAAKTASISVVAYAAPQVSNMVAERCASDGVVNEEGTYIKLTVADVGASVSGKNTFTRQYRYRKVGDSAWTTGTYAVGSQVIGGGAISIDNPYEVQVIFTDAFSSVNVARSVPTAKPTVDYKAGGKGIAFGQVATEDNFTVAMDARFKGITNFDNDVYVANPIGTASGGTGVNHKPIALCIALLGSFTLATTKQYLTFSDSPSDAGSLGKAAFTGWGTTTLTATRNMVCLLNAQCYIAGLTLNDALMFDLETTTVIARYAAGAGSQSMHPATPLRWAYLPIGTPVRVGVINGTAARGNLSTVSGNMAYDFLSIVEMPNWY